MTNVSRTNLNGQRPKSDLYPTKPECTAPLVRLLPEIFRRGSKWWEPACGDGAIVKVLHAYDMHVIATDKTDHGMGGGRDFFSEKKLLAPDIITNCPYGQVTPGGATTNIADAFIAHALSLHPRNAFFLLPLTHYSGVGRTSIMENAGLHQVIVFRNRVTLSPKHLNLKSGGVTTYAWFWWRRGFTGDPILRRVTASVDPLLEKRRAA